MQYLLLSILLYGLSGKYWQVLGFGFGIFNPANYCPSPSYYVVAPSYPVFAAYPAPSMGFFDTLLQAIFAKKGKSYPPSFAYPPPPPPPIYYPPPPPPPAYYPPPPQPPSIQDHIIKVHITKDSGDDDDEEQDHHHHHHDHHNHHNHHGHKMEDGWN